MHNILNELDLQDIRKISHFILERTDQGKELPVSDQHLIEAGCHGGLTPTGVTYLMKMLKDVLRGTHLKLF